MSHKAVNSKAVSAAEALRCVASGMRVYIHPGCAEPEALVEALIARASDLRDVEVVHLMTLGDADYIAPHMAGHFRVREEQGKAASYASASAGKG